MKKLVFIVLFLCKLSVEGYGQPSTIDQSIKDISAQIKQVKTKDGTIDQKLKQVKDNIVALELATTDTKGKITAESYTINLADINRYGIKEVLVGQTMCVEIPIKDKNKYIEYDKEGKFDSYLPIFKINVYDVDNSRALINAVQGSVSIAEDIESAKYDFSSQGEIFAALYRAVKSSPDNTNVQKIASTAEKKEKLDFTSIKDGKTEKFEFNLSDINPGLVRVKVTSAVGPFVNKSLSVVLETTNGQKVVKQFENDIPKTYVSSFEIYPTDIENAKQIKNLIGLAIQNIKSGTTSLSASSHATSTVSQGSAPTHDENNSAASSNTATTKSNTQPTHTGPIKYPTPEFSDIPYWYDESTNALFDLERVSASAAARAKGLWGSEDVLIFPERASPIRIKRSALKFMIHLENAQADPHIICELKSCTVNEKKGQREYQYKKTGMGHVEHENVTIPITYKKIGDGIYLISIMGDLPTPEAFFSITTTKQAYAFGIN